MSYDLAKEMLNILDAHFFVIGNTGTGKTSLLHEANIPNSRYFDFDELLNEDNFSRFESTFLNTPERTLILDAVEFPLNLENSKIERFIKTARKYGKRLIILASPKNADPILCRFRNGQLCALGAIIHLDKWGDRFDCDIETVFDPTLEEEA